MTNNEAVIRVLRGPCPAGEWERKMAAKNEDIRNAARRRKFAIRKAQFAVRDLEGCYERV